MSPSWKRLKFGVITYRIVCIALLTGEEAESALTRYDQFHATVPYIGGPSIGVGQSLAIPPGRMYV